jgi:antirestriction protein ArdC
MSEPSRNGHTGVPPRISPAPVDEAPVPGGVLRRGRHETREVFAARVDRARTEARARHGADQDAESPLVKFARVWEAEA